MVDVLIPAWPGWLRWWAVLGVYWFWAASCAGVSLGKSTVSHLGVSPDTTYILYSGHWNKIAPAAGCGSSLTVILTVICQACGACQKRSSARAGEGMCLIPVTLLKPLLFAVVAISSSECMGMVRKQTNFSWGCLQCCFLALRIPARPGLNPEFLWTAERIWEALRELTVFPWNYHFGALTCSRNLCCFAYRAIAVNCPNGVAVSPRKGEWHLQT